MTERLIEGDSFEPEEVALAGRNPGMPLEGLAWPVTPVGMHYQLTHFDIPYHVASDWRLNVGGLTQRSLALNLDDIRRRPAVTMTVTMECAGNGRALLSPRYASRPWFHEAVSTAQWTGTPLAGVLNEAGLQDDCIELVFTSFDCGIQDGEALPFQRSLGVVEALRDDVLLAYAMNGEPLPPQHGFPLRLIVPGWYGMASVKWLGAIEAVDRPFQGYQMMHSYRYQHRIDEPGEPVTLMRVRALMIPPGVVDFYGRRRIVQSGRITLQGRAWAGRRQIEQVEISADDGVSWQTAELEPAVSDHAWKGWRSEWNARPGAHTLCVRATDREGDAQPMEPFWTRQGVGNNMVQRVSVLVE